VAVPNAVGKVVDAHWDGENLWNEAEIYDEEVAEKIRKGLIRHVSIGADYERLDVVDGKILRGLHNAELSLVAVPGIPEANIQIVEKLAEQGAEPLSQASIFWAFTKTWRLSCRSISTLFGLTVKTASSPSWASLRLSRTQAVFRAFSSPRTSFGTSRKSETGLPCIQPT